MSILAVVAIAIITPNWVAGAGHFCYSDAEGCGPNTAEWGPVCLSGKRQSPIDLPPGGLITRVVPINVHAYRGDSFRMQNNGHSIQIDFNNEGPSTQEFYLPDPLKVSGNIDEQTPRYKFSSAHFHWGANDSVGSEHCINGKCGALELHLVHYSANYPSLAEAVASGDENALAVIGVIFDAAPRKTGVFTNMINRGEDTLGPIWGNLESVEHVDHDSSKWVTINQRLDFRLALHHYLSSNTVYSYKGSLTTPGCNEQVNWYVLGRRPTIAPEELEAFRSIVKDGRGVTLVENNRPVQPLNGRKVLYSWVVPYFTQSTK